MKQEGLWRSMNRKRFKEIGILWIFLAVTVSTVGYLFYINSTKVNKEIVYNGSVDIFDLNKNETMRLDGQWEFYPEVFIDPQADFSLYEDIKVLEYVPKPKNAPDEDYNYGTYRIMIHTNNDTYGVKLRTVRYAYELFMNGESIIKLGKVSDDPELGISDSLFKLGVGSAENKQIELVMHVSNHYYPKGGIFSSVIFGDAETMMSQNIKAKLIEGGLSVVLITLGFHYIITFLNRKDAFFLICFGMMAISVSVVLLLMSEQVLRDLIPLNFVARASLQIFGVSCFLFSMHCFVSRLYHRWSNPRIKKIIDLYMFIWVPIIIINVIIDVKHSIYMLLQSFYIIGIILIIAHTLYVLWHAYKNEAKGYLYATIIILFLTDYLLILITKALYTIELGYIQQVLLSLVVYFSIFLINEYYRYDYDYAIELSRIVDVGEQKRESFMKTLTTNVLTPLKGRVKDIESLMGNTESNLNEENYKKLSFIRNQTQEIVFMLENINRLYPGDKEAIYNYESYNLKEIIQENIDIFIVSNPLESRTITNGFDLDVFVKLDRSGFATVLYQVLKNALDHTEANGVIKIKGKIVSDFVYVYVTDDGIGIEETNLPFVFDAFFKVNNENPNRFGLGLTLGKEILEEHGGSISIRSTFGVGTRVSLSLPITLEPSKKNLVSKSEEAMALPVEMEFTIMVVSDNKSLIENLSKTYKEVISYQYKKQGTQALAKTLMNRSVDVLILDYNNTLLMQDKVSHHLRKYIDIFSTPILMIAPQQIILDMWFHQQIDVNDFIASPVDYRNLVIKINNLYRTKKAVESGIEKEFRYLHSQISPHFLYNTLNTIIGMSYYDAEKTRQALFSLSVYLRAKLDVFNSEVFVMIDQEIEVIEAYLSIEKLRYGENINVVFDIEEELHFKVPALIIQNIIENAFKHAFNLSEPHNEIIIKIKNEDHKNIIEIIDNGVGMDEETLANILDKKTDGFGYKTTFQRMALIKNSEFIIESKLHKGTHVTLILPEVNNDKSNPY